jgi:hypothetical protein
MTPVTQFRATQVEEHWIETFTGRQFHFLDPSPDEIDIRDIAHALSLVTRYGGHVRQFYSVAEHSLLISDRLRRSGHKEHELVGLLHDASEAYLGDMPKPIKHCLPDYQALEASVEEAIAKRFDVAWPLPDVVKEYDRRILRDERVQCMGGGINEWGTDVLEPLGVEVKFMAPTEAEAAFLDRFRELTRGRRK